MGHHGAKCTQIDESMCQGVICTCQNFFPFTNLVVGVTFLKVILQLLQKCTNLVIPDFSGCFFIFVTTSISHIPPSPLVQCTALSINAWRILVQQKQDFDQNFARVVVFSVPVLHIFLSVMILLQFLSNRDTILRYCLLTSKTFLHIEITECLYWQ